LCPRRRIADRTLGDVDDLVAAVGGLIALCCSLGRLYLAGRTTVWQRSG